MALESSNGQSQERGGGVRHHGKPHFVRLGKVKRQEAEAKAGQADYLLMRVQQRIIDDILGHISEEARRRRGHLTPQVKAQAVAAVFNSGPA